VVLALQHSLVYRSEVDGRKLTFERAGNRGNNFYMSDSETGSHWQQIGGECFEGPMKGKRLTLVPFLLTTWGEWRGLHPQSLVLIPEEKYHDQYAAMAKRIATIAYGSNKSPDRELIGQQDSRLPNYEQVIGIEAGGAHKAYPVAALHQAPLLNDMVGARPVVLIYAANTDTTTAFSRVAGGRTLTFKASTPGLIVDDETGSAWTAYGECTAGKFKGQRLERIVPQPGLWFAWAEFNPDTEVIRARHTSAVKLVTEDNVAEKKIIAVLGATGAQAAAWSGPSSMIRTVDSLRERSPETSTEPRRRNWRSWARKSSPLTWMMSRA